MELCINRPNEAFIETRDGWRREQLAFADFEWCSRLAKLVANESHQRIDATAPLLSASLPSGERLQIVMPPATTPGCHGNRHPPAGRAGVEHRRSGRPRYFSPHQGVPAGRLDETEQQLLRLLPASEFEAFMRLAVRSRKNIVVSGPTDRGRPRGPRRSFERSQATSGW